MKKFTYILISFALFSLTAYSQQKNSVWPVFEPTLTPVAVNEIRTSLQEEQKPSCNDFSVNLSEHSTISVYSPTGAIVDKLDINGKEKVCFGNNYPQGIYLLRISNDSFASSTVLIRD